MRLNFSDGLESWRVGLILAGLGLAFAGTLLLDGSRESGPSMGRDIAVGAAAIVGLLMVVAGLIGRQTTSSAAARPSLIPLVYLVLPVISYLAKLSTGWKLILGAWCVGGIIAAVIIARRRD